MRPSTQSMPPVLRSLVLVLALLALSGCGAGKATDDPRAPAAITGTDLVRAAPAGASWAPRPRAGRVATVRGDELLLHTASGDKDFLPGVNLGSTTPGHSPGEHSLTAADYRRAFPLMRAMGLRVVRIYTIHPPAFYAELARYNRAHPDAPLYLVHGVYLPDESYVDAAKTLYDPAVTRAFRAELRDASAAVHGDLRRAPQPGRASGTWATDVSPWLAAWIVGVELDPAAAHRTDRREATRATPSGRFLRATADASATERWLAAGMDELAKHERRRGSAAPIAFVNWPTTDPLEHPDEPLPEEDLAQIDANHVRATGAWPAGTFASYHAYPYYPDFLRHEPGLRQTRVAGRADPYAGYLARLARHHAGLPVLVTEFGVPSSLGSAHRGTLGRDQGAHTEQDAMTTDAALLRLIAGQGLSGGFVFAWTDEWFKRTWNTEPQQLPADRRPLWHDPLTNEQWFGLLAADAKGSPDGGPRTIAREDAGPVRRVDVGHDESWVTVTTTLAAPPREPVQLAFDVVPGGRRPPRGGAATADRVVVVDPGAGRAQALVRAGLDPVQLDAAWRPGERRRPVDGWSLLRLTTNRALTVPTSGRRLAPEFLEVGRLRRGTWDPAAPGYRSDATWRIEGDTLTVRLPWSALGLADPSSRRALLPRSRTARTVAVERIGLTVGVGRSATPTDGVTWEPWQRTFSQLRVKAGIDAFVDAVAEVTP